MNRRSFLYASAGMVLSARIFHNELSWLGAAPANVRIVDFDARGHRLGVKEVEKIKKTEVEWHQQLTPEQVSPNRPCRRLSVRAYSIPNFRHHSRMVS